MRPKIKGAREALLNAGRNTLIEKGYTNLKIKDITRSAGVSAGSFYNYFDDKKAFTMTIISGRWNELLSRVDEAIENKSSMSDRLKAIYSEIESFEDDYYTAIMQVSHDYDLEEFKKENEVYMEELKSRIGRVVDDAVDNGAIEADIVEKLGIKEIILRNLIDIARTKHIRFEDFYDGIMRAIGTGKDSDNALEDHDPNIMEKILDNTQTKIFWKDDQRRFLGVNKAFLDYYGFKSKDELIGKTDEDLGWHSDPKPFMNDEIRVLQGETTSKVHGTCIAKGEERDILASKSPVYENGKIVGLVGSFDDVTVEYRQRDEIGRLSSILNAIPGGIAIFKQRFNDFYCIQINDYLVEMLGGKQEDYLNKGFMELAAVVHPDDQEKLLEDSKRIHESGHSTSGIYRFHNKLKDEYIWLQIEGRFVRLPNDEEFAYYNYINVDELERAKSAEEMSRRLYGHAINAANLFLWTYDIKTRRMTFDRNDYTVKSRERLGLNEIIEDAPNQILKYILPNDRDGFLKMFDDIEAGSESAMCEIRFRPSPEQRLLYLRLVITAEMDRNGKPIKGYGMTQDVTKEKLADEQYAREESFIRVDDEPGYVAKGHYDLTANKVLEYWRIWDTAMDVTDDLSYDDVVDGIMDYIASGEDRARCHELFDRQNLLYRFNTGEDRVSIEYQRAKGKYAATWVYMELKMFKGPSSGDVECFIYMYDVTDKHLRQQAAANLQAMGYKFIGLIDTVSNGVTYFKFSNDNDGMDAYVNTKDYANTVADEIAKHADAEELKQVLDDAELTKIVDELKKYGSYSFVCMAHSKTGERKRILSSYRFIDKENHIIYNTIQDITKEYLVEQEQMEKLNAALQAADTANELKSQFLSSVSHDMRTPLNAVLGYDRLALDAADPAQKDDYLKKIATAGNTLLSLINDTLDLQKIESDAIELKPEPVKRERMVEEIVNAVKPLMDEKNIEFVFNNDKAVSATINVDVMRIEKIFINLLSNAIKFTQPGGRVDFIIECVSLEDDKVHDRIIVRDNGCGMSKDFLPKVFEPFTQERTEETADIGGTGLGLSIVKSLVEKMGGTIEVESELGKGTEFVVHLNLDRIEDEKLEEAGIDMSLGNVDMNGIKVLLVEDNAMNIEIAESLLEMQGAVVETATNGKTGSEMFIDSKPGTFDIILMDIRMPVMDGYEATLAIRNSGHEEARSIPIVAMTADAYEEDVEKSQSWGMNGHLAKPIEPDKLFGMIAALVAK